MPGAYRDRAVVLRTTKLGEADRIVTMLTEGHGKVRAVAKGVRRSGSRWGARLEPAWHLAVQCARGRELDVVTQAETLDAFRPLRESYPLMVRTVAMLEAADRMSHDRHADPGPYRLLVGALRTLAATGSEAVPAAYLWRLLGLSGFDPVLERCVRCDQPIGAGIELRFDLDGGGVCCGRCGRDVRRRCSPEARAVLVELSAGRVRRVLEAGVASAVLAEVERLGVAAVEHHAERRLRAAALL